MKVDPEDMELVAQYTWSQEKRGYWRSTTKPQVSLHRLIMGSPKGMVVDHINGDKSDNRRSNLRVCTQAQNCANSKRPVSNISGYKGVHFYKQYGKYSVKLQVNRKQLFFGYFEDKHEAAKAYNEAAIKHYGEFAKLNEVPV